MGQRYPPSGSREPTRPRSYSSVTEPAVPPDSESPPPSVLHVAPTPAARAPVAVPPSVEQRVAITLSVSDGFRFGCGLLLAGIAFYFALLIVVAVALLFASVLGLPLPFGLGH
jgi:hypothetical protein